MKKVLFLLLSIVIFSCKDDDEGIVIPGGSSSSECRIIKEEFFYNNDTSYKTFIDYVYSGELLVKKIRSGRFRAFDSVMYYYDINNRLSYTIEPDYNTGSLDTSNIFQYDQLGNLTKIIQIEDNMTNANRGRDKATVTSDSEGNILEYQILELDGQTVLNQRSVVTYDRMKNPFKGIILETVNLLEMFPSNNVTSTKYYENNVLTNNTTINLVYNLQGYPVTSLEKDSDGDVTSRTYTYSCS